MKDGLFVVALLVVISAAATLQLTNNEVPMIDVVNAMNAPTGAQYPASGYTAIDLSTGISLSTSSINGGSFTHGTVTVSNGDIADVYNNLPVGQDIWYMNVEGQATHQLLYNNKLYVWADNNKFAATRPPADLLQ